MEPDPRTTMSEQESKPWYLSRGVIGGAVAAIAAAVGLVLKVSLDEAAQSQLTDLVLTIVTAVAGIVAVWGRVSATKQVGK